MAKAILDSKGVLSGQWTTSIGSAGTFILHLHDSASERQELTSLATPPQLHTTRTNFGAIQVDRAQITIIADELQQEFKNATVVVTVITETEQSRLLPDFKNLSFKSGMASLIKFYVQQSEPSGVNRIAQLEFGPNFNFATTQGEDEAWVLGMREKIRNSVVPLERTYATNIKRFGLTFSQLLILSAVVSLSSFDNLRDRAVFMSGVLILIGALNWFHNRYLPLAAIYLGEKREGRISRFVPSVLSWAAAIVASVVAALLGAYLQGWFGLK